MNVTVQFWLLFLITNSFYFIPRFILEIFHVQFIPVRELTVGPIGQRLRHLMIRRNSDLFRVSVDLFVWVFAYALFLRAWVDVLPYAVAATLYFLLSLGYQIYYHAFQRIYHLDPVFFHDFLMLKTAGQIFVHEFGVRNLIILCSMMLIAVTGAVCIYALISTAAVVSFGTYSWILIGLIAAGSLYSVLHYSYGKYPQLTFQSPLPSFIRNVRISRKSRKSVANLTLKYMKQFNVDPAVSLERKPDVYLIVVESYGRIICDDQILRKQYEEYIFRLGDDLAKNGWNAMSAFTRSPVMGGASWISYTSMMYGLNVRNQGVYSTMLKNVYMAEYDSLFHWLKRQGYITFRISSLGGYEKMEIPYESYSRLYGIDHWIKYKDLDYSGIHYGFGPSPPDQYALWKGSTRAAEIAGDRPKAIFFITQNSHTPYDSPLRPVEDWRTLDDKSCHVKKPSIFWSRPKFEKYGNAIQYQLEYLVDFITKAGGPNDVFILAGDHQPPSVSMTIENFDTPLHVISKDRGFVEQWQQYGFTSGLVPGDAGYSMRQEAVHWALLRSLIRQYGRSQDRLPEFLPEGIPY